MRSGFTCLLMLTLGACCLPDEKQIPEGQPVADAGAPTSQPAASQETPASQQGLFEYCANVSSPVRQCWTGCAPGDQYAGWWCDRPEWYQTQIMSEDGTKCWIIDCNVFQPEVGFVAGGFGDVRSLFGASPIRYQRNGSGANTTYGTNWCWNGLGFPTWGWGEFDWGPPASHPSFKSFACSTEVQW